MQGHSVDEYRAPLFLAWQLTNRCGARCITCCEESGPDKAWGDELRRDEALDLARRIAAFGILSNMVVAVVTSHLNSGFFMNWSGQKAGEGFEYHILAIALALVVMLRGSGAASVDRALSA